MSVEKISNLQYLQNYYPSSTTTSNKETFSNLLNDKLTTDKTSTVTAKWGNTVWGLAQTYHTDVNSIAKLNNLSNPNYIQVGQKLTIPDNQTLSSSTTTDSSQTNLATTNLETTSSSQTTSSTNSDASSTNDDTGLSKAESDAKAYIVEHESGGNYNARNGKYIGKYQLDKSYLNGDYSPANQDKVAAQYVSQRYGSWVNAMKHWETYHWY
ncbi:LysM peptidoglycan-binding domain-containing protein [Liquorilactobacillus sicerae]|uniref:aggregation-promoting factor n=1 Tax=Liquorilactobacillus sicerae TaxID=1416943 RepID=UPI0024800998|nr:LysM peptidoglycan-binding domain-containing protein [Liquorilactobacillus sicerae]